MKIYTLVLTFFVGCSAYAASETKEFDSNGLAIVSVENTSGKVLITAATESKASVVATKNIFSDKCKMTIDRSGTKLVIKVEKTNSFFSKEDCDVDFEVKVPKAVSLNLAIGSGNLTVNGIQGDLAFKVGSGDILADGIFKKIDGKSGSGKIVVNGLTGGGELKSGSGEIDLKYAISSLNGELVIKTGSGDSTILFPKGSKVNTQFNAGSGKLMNELGDNSSAAFKVSMKAGSGDLKIRSY